MADFAPLSAPRLDAPELAGFAGRQQAPRTHPDDVHVRPRSPFHQRPHAEWDASTGQRRTPLADSITKSEVRADRRPCGGRVHAAGALPRRHRRAPTAALPRTATFTATATTATATAAQDTAALIWSGGHALAAEQYAARAQRGLFAPRSLFAESRVSRESSERRKRVLAAGGDRPGWR